MVGTRFIILFLMLLFGSSETVKLLREFVRLGVPDY
jgi:hypothetical protein